MILNINCTFIIFGSCQLVLTARGEDNVPVLSPAPWPDQVGPQQTSLTSRPVASLFFRPRWEAAPFSAEGCDRHCFSEVMEKHPLSLSLLGFPLTQEKIGHLEEMRPPSPPERDLREGDVSPHGSNGSLGLSWLWGRAGELGSGKWPERSRAPGESWPSVT